MFNVNKESFQSVWLEHFYCLFAEIMISKSPGDSVSVGNCAFMIIQTFSRVGVGFVIFQDGLMVNLQSYLVKM